MSKKKETQLEEATMETQNAVKVLETPTVETDEQPRFSKQQLLNSHWYSHRRDMLNVLLDDEKQYSHSEVTAMIKAFEETEVK